MSPDTRLPRQIPSPPPELGGLQQDFLDATFAVNQAVLGALGRRGAENEPSRQIGVYRGSVMGNLTNALADVFPVSRTLVGADFFDAVAVRYIRSRPPRHSALSLFGDKLSDYLAGLDPLADFPFIPDVASLEWARHEALLAPDGATLTLQHLQQLASFPAGAIHLQWAPGSRLLNSQYSISRIWAAHQDAGSPPEGLDWEKPERVWVCREGYEVLFHRLSEPESVFIGQLMQPASLEYALETCLRLYAEVDPSSLLFNVLQRGGLIIADQP